MSTFALYTWCDDLFLTGWEVRIFLLDNFKWNLFCSCDEFRFGFRVSLTGEKTKPMKLAEVTSINVNRTKTEMEEFNRVLGGGVVPGSLVLIGGDPGIGKSTLLLQVSTQLSQVGTVLYVSGEESAQQIKLRAERLGDIDSEFYLYAETNMQSVRSEVERIQPDFLIIDSIQTIMSPEISGVQGSVSQVREVTAELMQLAKTNNIAIFIVGHVTKEGTLAGPRMLEHMVDTVLYFEGERHHTFRILRAVKNRFGSCQKCWQTRSRQERSLNVLPVWSKSW